MIDLEDKTFLPYQETCCKQPSIYPPQRNECLKDASANGKNNTKMVISHPNFNEIFFPLTSCFHLNEARPNVVNSMDCREQKEP